MSDSQQIPLPQPVQPDQELPQHTKRELMPGGQFPGTAETLATPVGSDREVRVPIAQKRNRHLQLSKEEFRARSAQQREIDARADAGTPAGQPSQMSEEYHAQSAAPPIPPPNPPTQKKPRRSRPKGAKGKAPRAAVPKDKPIGRLYPVTSPTPAPKVVSTPDPHPTMMALETRMSRLEAGMDKIVEAIAAIHNDKARQESDSVVMVPGQRTHVPPEFAPDLAADQLIEEDDDELDEEEFNKEFYNMPEPGESCDAPPLRVVATPVEDGSEWESGLRELQQMIVKRRPDKAFRFQWAGLTRAAQYNEWPPERREAFDQVFNSMVAHPKFIHQMATFMRGSRGGNCIGYEQIARVCGMVAGFLVVYQLAAAGR